MAGRNLDGHLASQGRAPSSRGANCPVRGSRSEGEQRVYELDSNPVTARSPHQPVGGVGYLGGLCRPSNLPLEGPTSPSRPSRTATLPRSRAVRQWGRLSTLGQTPARDTLCDDIPPMLHPIHLPRVSKGDPEGRSRDARTNPHHDPDHQNWSQGVALPRRSSMPRPPPPPVRSRPLALPLSVRQCPLRVDLGVRSLLGLEHSVVSTDGFRPLKAPEIPVGLCLFDSTLETHAMAAGPSVKRAKCPQRRLPIRPIRNLPRGAATVENPSPANPHREPPRQNNPTVGPNHLDYWVTQYSR